MGKVISTLGTLFGSENRWWEQEKQKEKQKEQERRKNNLAQRMKQIEQQALQKAQQKQIEQQEQQKAQQKQTGPAYGQTHDPNKEYKETQANVLGAIASVSKQPGQTEVPKTETPYVVKNRDALTSPSKVEAFMQEAKQWSLKNLSVDKQDLFWRLPMADKIRVMESQNPDNELNYLSRGK